MVKTFILTSSEHGPASLHLEKLVLSKNIEVKAILMYIKKPKKNIRYLRKRLKKIKNIGIGGALIGIYMRKWFKVDVLNYTTIVSLTKLAKDYNIELYSLDSLVSKNTKALLSKLNVQIGLSIGNGYIPSKFYGIPKLGMINIHHEILPEYQNAQSVIWQLYNGSSKSGITIHQINKTIDGGDILLCADCDIIFCDTLGETVSKTYAKLWELSSIKLVELLVNFKDYFDNRQPQLFGQRYTTPSLVQFLRINRNFHLLKKRSK